MRWLIGAIFSFWSAFSLVVIYVLLKDVQILFWDAGVLLVGILCIKKYRDYKSGKAEKVYEEKERLRQIRISEKKRKEGKKEEEKQRRQEKREEEKRKVWGLHKVGLPLAYRANCSVRREEERFIFEGGGNCFILSADRLTDISVRTEREVNSQYVSSVGGAIGGAIAFGPLGAAIGGRVKEKKSTEVREYLIFTYLKDGEISYISIELLAPSPKVWEWQKEFHQRNGKNEKTVDL